MQLHGIDFSGAAAPGCDIWITSGTVQENGTLSVDDIRPAAAEFRATRREPLLGKMCDFLAGVDGAVGLDFSFGLPQTVLTQAGAISESDDWTESIAWFCDQFENADAPEMQKELREFGRASSSQGVEHKRQTDVERSANSPYSNITRYQTLHGIRDVLAPLIGEGKISVQPMAPAEGVPTLLEIYPAATLRDLGTHDQQYKIESDNGLQRREEILACLYDREVERLEETLEQAVLSDSDGDALDSLVAAVATGRAVESGFSVEEERYDPVEGYIYV